MDKNGGQMMVAFVVDDSGTKPHESDTSLLVAAAIKLGFKFSSDQPFLHMIEKGEDGKLKRRVAWTFDAEREVKVEGEVLNFREFKRRFRSAEWIQANPKHIISQLRETLEIFREMDKRLLRQAPHVCVRAGKNYALIPPNCTEERKAELLAKLR